MGRFLVTVCLAVAASPIWAAAPCSPDQGFGVTFGSSVYEYRGQEIRSQRPHSRFASYKIQVSNKDPRFSWYSAEADRESGKVFSVTAHQKIVPDMGPTPDYEDRVLPLAKHLITKIAKESSIPIDVSGMPPYSAKDGGLNLGLWFSFGRGGRDASFSVSCTNEALQEQLYRSILQSEFDKIES